MFQSINQLVDHSPGAKRSRRESPRAAVLASAVSEESTHVDQSKSAPSVDEDHLKVVATTDAAETGFGENDPEGVAFEYVVLERRRPPTEAALLRQPNCRTAAMRRAAVTASATAKGSALQQSVIRLTRRDGKGCGYDCQTSQHGCDVGYGGRTPVDATLVIQIGPLPKSNWCR
jgi:hypothetical protein